MKSKYLVLLLLVLGDLPLYILLLRVLFRGRRLGGGKGQAAAEVSPTTEADPAKEADDPSPNREEPLWRSLVDLGFLREEGGGNKLFLFVLTAALLVYIEYSVVLSLVPSLRDAVLF